jgi:hypothetical protein
VAVAVAVAAAAAVAAEAVVAAGEPVVGNRKKEAAAARSAERRAREERAPRLRNVVPELVTLRLVMEERYPLGATKHTRHVVVPHSAALFMVPCGDAACDSNGHDITSEVLRALAARATRTEGQHSCDGFVGGATCARTLHFVIEAEYTPPA